MPLSGSLVMLSKRYLDDRVGVSQVTCVTGNTGVSYMLHNTGYRFTGVRVTCNATGVIT